MGNARLSGVHDKQSTVAVGYVRVSTSLQADEGVSLQAQKARIEAHCASRGLTLADVLTDAGISGRKATNRPALEEALSRVCEIKGHLVCYSLSRLARSTKDAINISERLDKAGAQMVMLAEQVDTSTAAGRMFYTVLAALAAFESDQISERTTMALRYRRDRGERYTRQPPYGFEFQGNRLAPNEHEQMVIEHMKSLRRSGLSYREVASWLTNERIFNRVGSPFPLSHIHRLLSQRMRGTD